jgi:hypothetical protein
VNDPTEAARHQRLVQINAEPGSREALEARYGQVWDTEQLRQDFDVSASWPRWSWSAAGPMA